MEILKLNKFLVELKKNNNKEFFTNKKIEYESLRNQFTDLIKSIIFDINNFDKELGILDPKQCIFRINRDLRFTKDKSPYKTTFSAQFTKNNKDTDTPTYYMHIDENNNLLVAGGIYMPSNIKLTLIRNKMISDPQDFEEIIYDKTINKIFNGLDKSNSLKKVPSGFPDNNPLSEYLKLKNLILSKETSLNQITDKDLEDLIIKQFKLIFPLINLIRKIN